MHKKQIKTPVLLTLAAVIAIGATATIAEADTKVGRYTSIAAGPSFEQQNLLKVNVSLHFPSSVQTVRDAMDLLLSESGYRLEEMGKLDRDTKYLFAQPLPQAHRAIGPISLIDALQTLAGDIWTITPNHLTRTISFDLKDKASSSLQLVVNDSISKEAVIDAGSDVWSCGKSHKVHSVTSIYFSPNSFRLGYKDMQKIDAAIKEAIANKKHIALKSYTDPTGPDALHITMAQMRGEAVSKYIAGKGHADLLISNEFLGASYPNEAQPLNLQRVTELHLVSNACLERDPVIHAIDASESVEDALKRWAKADGKKLIYDVVNQKSQKVQIQLKSNYQFNSSLEDSISRLIDEVKASPEVGFLEAVIYQRDGVVLVKGKIQTNAKGVD